MIVDDFKLHTPKTRDFLGVLAALQVQGTRPDRVHTAATRTSAWPRATSGTVEVTTGETLNTYQVLRSDKLVFTRGAFEQVEKPPGQGIK